MAATRYLGSAWASVHGPAEPRALLTWVLDRGFAGVSAGPGPRAVDWTALRAALQELPARVACSRVGAALEGPSPAEASLASGHAGERAAARDRITAAIALARMLGCRRVVLDPGAVKVRGEPGPVDLGDPSVPWTADLAGAQRARRNAVRDAALDRLCRGLYEILKSNEDIELCLTCSRSALGLGDPESLAAVFEDLPGPRLRYWHDAPVACRHGELLGTAQGAWLEAFAPRMAGMTLADSHDGSLYLPPGSGGVDYPLIASYRRRFGHPVPLVVELDLAVEPVEIPGIHAFLNKFGL